MLFITSPRANQYQTKSYYSSGNLLKQGLIFTGACDLLLVSGFKENTTALRYVMFFDAAALPAAGAVPKMSISVPGGNASFSYSAPILPMSTNEYAVGVYWALSTTANTLTLAASGDCWVNALTCTGS